MITVESHPVLAAPTKSQALSWGADEFARRMKQRADMIAMEQSDPLRYGWEPPIWSVVDALLGIEFCSASLEQYINRRLGMTWLEYGAAMRKLLGFDEAVRMVLILGGNRSSKSEYSAKRAQGFASCRDYQRVFAYHMSGPRSKQDQQPLYWKYMPTEWKIQKASEQTYIKYKSKTGFSDDSFINPIGSYVAFNNYMQDKSTALEGIEPDFVNPDELIPVDWLETMIYRLATRSGKGVTCFTPVNGYTPSVGLFCTGASVVRESTAYLLPEDGLAPDIPTALGLTPEEVMELKLADKQKRAATAPRSRPEDVFAWLEKADGIADAIARPFGKGVAQLPCPDGRKFMQVPRVMKSARPDLAVVFFHASDNPYGNPLNVMETAVNKQSSSEIKIRVYGLAEKAAGGRFPSFNKKVHIIKPGAIPDDGVNYMFMDPAGDRNFFMSYFRKLPGCAYQYREWPGNYNIPGVGFPGPWTVPSGKKEGRNDGARGEAQEKFGFGLLRYKFEMARLEMWEDFKKWCQDNKIDPHHLPDVKRPTDDELYEWDEYNGADEVIEQRYVDSRAASTPRVEMDRPRTLMTDLEEIGFDFMLTPGSDEDTGIAAIESALAYDQAEDMSFFNHPSFMISEDCANTIYALENYTGVDGQKGACRDPIDILRYFFTLDLDDAPGPSGPRGGFHYGTRLPSMRRRSRTEDGRPLCMGPRLRRQGDD